MAGAVGCASAEWLSSSRCPLAKPECRALEWNCTRGRSSGSRCEPTARCPRCDAHALRPHVCPDPKPLADVASLFDATYVLCAGEAQCLRHRQRLSPYWPQSMAVEAHEGPAIDRRLVAEHGAPLAWLFGLPLPQSPQFGRSALRPLPTRPPIPPDLIWARHRVRTLFSHLELVRTAHLRNLSSVFVIEADVRPLGGRRELRPPQLAALAARLRSRRWSVLRAAGQYHDYSSSYRREPKACPRFCRCEPVPGLEGRVCEIAAASHAAAPDAAAAAPRPRRRHAGEPPRAAEATAEAVSLATVPSLSEREFCDVRDTTAYAVSAAAFPTFLQARERALRAAREAFARHLSSTSPSTSPNAPSASASFGRLPNSSFGLPTDRHFSPEGLPWIDLWLPSALDALHVLPSLAVQHVKQHSADSSDKFARACLPRVRGDVAVRTTL